MKFAPNIPDTIFKFVGLNVDAILGHGPVKLPKPMRTGPTFITRDYLVKVKIFDAHGTEDLEFLDLGYTVIIAHYDKNEEEPWDKIRACASILSLTEDKRFFQNCIANGIINLTNGEWSQVGDHNRYPAVPHFFDTPEKILPKLQTFSSLTNLDQTAAKALSWYHRSLQTDDEIFSFLSAWIACETITGSDDKKITKIVNMLHNHFKGSKNYTCDDTGKCKEFFLLERLSRIRGNLAHGGKTDGITAEISAYVQMLFSEMFFAYYKCEPLGVVFSFLKERRQHIHKELIKATE